VPESSHPRIAVDASGGDHGPSVVVPGAVAAARQLGGSEIICVGPEDAIERELDRAGGRDLPVRVVHAPDTISMDEAPAQAVRRKTESSIVVGAQLVREGQADAFVSAGSTGAVTAAATLVIGRLPGVARPGIATVMPTRKGVCLVIDMGANVDCKPKHLLQFAGMGKIYAEHVLNLSEATVGLLNIGEEPGKGDELTQAAYALLDAHDPRFVGNIEGKHLFDGRASVVVCDGFVGNVVLKILESFGGFLLDSFRDHIRGNVRATLGAGLLKPAMKDFARSFDYAEYGGAPLLGCRGVVIIAHGRSSAQAITNAVRVADRGVRDRIAQRIQDEIEREQRELDAAAAESGSDPVEAHAETQKQSKGGRGDG